MQFSMLVEKLDENATGKMREKRCHKWQTIESMDIFALNAFTGVGIIIRLGCHG